MLNLKDAKEELEKKSYKDIQTETAWKWASRAARSYQVVTEVAMERKLAAWTIAEEFNHEAIEHAALVEDGAVGLLKEIQEAVAPYQEKAFSHLESKFNQDLNEEKV